jgi:hypothetical protein
MPAVIRTEVQTRNEISTYDDGLGLRLIIRINNWKKRAIRQGQRDGVRVVRLRVAVERVRHGNRFSF